MIEHGPECTCEACRFINRSGNFWAKDPAYIATSFFRPDGDIYPMIIYACSCRQEEIHTSMGVPSCSRCSVCGSRFAPLGVPVVGEPDPHTYVTRYNEFTGAAYEVCTKCCDPKDETCEQ